MQMRWRDFKALFDNGFFTSLALYELLLELTEWSVIPIEDESLSTIFLSVVDVPFSLSDKNATTKHKNIPAQFSILPADLVKTVEK